MRVWKLWTDEHRTTRKTGSERWKLTSARDNRHLFRMVVNDLTASSRQLAVRWSTATGRPRQTSRRERHHIIRNARVQPTSSSSAIAKVAPSLGALMSSRTIRRRLAEGHFGTGRPLRVLPLTPTHRRLRLEWCRA
ncbi:transposable element Tcb2 transposase [Trichonephila clavipes]|uniref:Transposable element Tcb2 transposase n=1 Tax=Trichonephila clavipes TaxID=2585209 RepID=A0A8X6S9W6_TRICX|nr:transposable element Tcb2 transposase [Trichonephila clavipes]